MLEPELNALVVSFLAKHGVGLTAEERLAWEEFYLAYDPVIRASIRRVHASWDSIDDLTLDVWVLLIRKLLRRAFDPGRGAIGAWISKIAERLAAKRVRRSSKQRGESLSEVQPESLVDPEPGPDVELERMQQHELFAALVSEFAATLNMRDGRIVILRFLECWAVSRIARELKASRDCIASAIHRLLPRLRDFLFGRGLGPVEKNSG
jgi:RNA polymerase sigma factor (sigma-70 family)